jgi:hypothetical protein
MKRITNSIKLIAQIGVMVCLSTGLMAQSYQLDDGSVLNLQGSATTYSGLTITSTTMSNSSSAILGTVANGSDKTVTLGTGCTFTDYYGLIRVTDDMTLDLQSSSSRNIPAKFLVNGSSATTTLMLSSTSPGLTLSGYDGSNRTITVNSYGVLDLSGSTADITLTNSLYLNGHESNSPVIKFVPTTLSSMPKIIIAGTNESFSSSAIDGTIYPDRHFSIDLSNATASTLDQTEYTAIQLTDASSAPAVNASQPIVTGNSDNAWTVGNMTTSNPSGTTRNVNFVLTFDPLFSFDTNVGGYARSWGALVSGCTEGVGDFEGVIQTLRKNATTGFDGSTASKNMTINIGNYTLGGSNQTFTIAAGKSLGLKMGSGGNFDGQINFGDATCRLVFFGTNVTDDIFGSNFSGASSTSYGTLQIGDGTTIASATFSLSGTKITTANHIATVVVKANSSLTITQ